MSKNILAYRMLISVNLSQHHEELARATISKLSYDSMKLQLRKIFGDNGEPMNRSSVKMEDINEVDCFDNETYYGYSRAGRGGHSNRRPFRGNFSGRRLFRSAPSRGKKGRNPVNSEGVISRCVVCESINHWAADCPDSHFYSEEASQYKLGWLVLGGKNQNS